MKIISKYLTLVAVENLECGELRVTINVDKDTKKLLNINGSLVDTKQEILGYFYYSTEKQDVQFQIDEAKKEYLDIIYNAVKKIIEELETLDI